MWSGLCTCVVLGTRDEVMLLSDVMPHCACAFFGQECFGYMFFSFTLLRCDAPGSEHHHHHESGRHAHHPLLHHCHPHRHPSHHLFLLLLLSCCCHHEIHPQHGSHPGVDSPEHVRHPSQRLILHPQPACWRQRGAQRHARLLVFRLPADGCFTADGGGGLFCSHVSGWVGKPWVAQTVQLLSEGLCSLKFFDFLFFDFLSPLGRIGYYSWVTKVDCLKSWTKRLKGSEELLFIRTNTQSANLQGSSLCQIPFYKMTLKQLNGEKKKCKCRFRMLAVILVSDFCLKFWFRRRLFVVVLICWSWLYESLTRQVGWSFLLNKMCTKACLWCRGKCML